MQVGKITRLTPQEKAAFFQALGELKRTKLFLGSSPTPEVEKAFHECSNEEREVFSAVAELLNARSVEPTNQKNPRPEKEMDMAAVQEEADRRKRAR